MIEITNSKLIESNRFLSFISTFNLALSLVGYQFVTTIFSGFIGATGESQLVSIPYRIVTMMCCLIILLLTKQQRNLFSGNLKCFLFFWGLLVFRFILDSLFGSFDISPEVKSKTWSYMIFMTLIPILAVIRSYEYVDIRKLLYYAFTISAITSIYMFFMVDEFQMAMEERVSVGNSALGSIAVGRTGLTTVLLSAIMFKYDKRRMYKIACAISLLFGSIIMLRSGSRGPILSIVAIAIVYFLSLDKSVIYKLFIIIIVISLGSIIIGIFDDFIHDFSPVLYERLHRDEGQLYDRELFYNDALNNFYKNPLLGYSLGIYKNGNLSYAHNIFLDALMQWGIIGACILFGIIWSLMKKIIYSIKYKLSVSWIGYIIVFYLTGLMISGSIFTTPVFSIFTVFFLCRFKQETNL